MLFPGLLERMVFGGWKLEVDHGGLGLLGAACVLVSGARGGPCSGLGRKAALECPREAAFPGAGAWEWCEGTE